MKLVVVIPSRDYKTGAGARIRYGRLVDKLAERSSCLVLEGIAGFDPRKVDCDAVIFSKCYDARALIAAHVLTRRGIRVGVDIFDDYFSQVADSRLIRLRSWLDQMLAKCTFALTSTAVTARLVEQYSPTVPVHILNDPAPAFDADGLAERLREKRAAVLSSGLVHVAWFGMGDNPHFAVGLQDVAAFADVLSRLSRHGLAVRLHILTNARSLNAAGLERIANLPVQATVELWSEERERKILGDAFVVFLPVSANGFSRAKSLNRAVTALAAGCQSLSVGHPLYAPLDPLIYRDVDKLYADLKNDSLLLSSATLNVLGERLEAFASATGEAECLLDFFGRLAPHEGSVVDRGHPLCVVHGTATNRAVHSMAHSVGGLSVAGPFCTAVFEFDAIVAARPRGDLSLLVAHHALPRLAPAVRRAASRPVRIAGRKYWAVTASDAADTTAAAPASLPLQLALYASVVEQVRTMLTRFFSAEHVIISEDSTLPFEQSEPAHG